MVLYTGGPFIPGLPPKKATPAKPTSARGASAALRARVLPTKSTPAPKPDYTPDYIRVIKEQTAAAAKPAPAPKKPDLGTGSIETKTAPPPSGGGTTGGGTTGGGTKESAAEKPIQVVLGQEEMDAAQQAADALREFQKNQANMQLQQALGKIDRAAIEQYKGISEDYAARGLARSGGKLMKEQQAIDERDRAAGEARQAVTDFLNELRLTGNLEQASTNLGKSQAFQDYITGRLSPAMGE